MLTTQEIEFINEIVALGGVFVETVETEEEDGTILVSLLVPVETHDAPTPEEFVALAAKGRVAS